MNFKMQVIKHPHREDWERILQRPVADKKEPFDVAQSILNAVKLNGDKAIRELTQKFDGVDLETFRVTKKEIQDAEIKISSELKNAIKQAANNIARFHERQITDEEMMETMPGIQCWRRSTPIQKVGFYIPGGTAPLFSTLLMLGIPAMLAGCKEIAVCSPADRKGELDPAILFTASFLGITTIYKIGGAQAIASMAYGTETVTQVNKIFGPGNNYVTAAKQLVQLEGTAIDMPAGPSELAIYADETANPAFVAADLLSQAEHGVDSQVLLITTHSILIDVILCEIDKQLVEIPRKNIVIRALENSRIILLKNEKEAIDLLNEYAPEHLIFACANADDLAEQIINAGSVFLGNYSPEAAGDYASGTNHTLPTNGFAKACSGVSVDSFVKKISFQKLDLPGLKNISNTIITMAEAEGLNAHANAVKIRMNV
jgi:histidinol dehydrogenase